LTPVFNDSAKREKIKPIHEKYSGHDGDINFDSFSSFYEFRLAVKGNKEEAKKNFDALVSEIENIIGG
jgi:hypothetical protein